MWETYHEKAKALLGAVLFTLNQTPITITSVILFLLIFFCFVCAARMSGYLLGQRALAHFHIDEGTRYNLERLTRYTIIIIGTIISFQFIGIDLSGLAVILGLFSVGVGFGLQNVTSNFVSGLILLFERPIKVGDRISIGETLGDIVNINMRATTVVSVDNITIIVPNSDFISGHVTNWSYGDKKVRLNLDVGVSYNSDLDTVLRCMREVADENAHVMRKPEPKVHFVGFGDSAWLFKLRCWLPDPVQYWEVLSELNCAIVRKFRANGIEIPFPQRDLHLRSSIPVPARLEAEPAGGTALEEK